MSGFQLINFDLAESDPAYKMTQAFQTRFDALSPTDNANAEQLLTSWGWTPAKYPGAMWRLFERALQVLA